jgi:hypothetical protein
MYKVRSTHHVKVLFLLSKVDAGSGLITLYINEK